MARVFSHAYGNKNCRCAQFRSGHFNRFLRLRGFDYDEVIPLALHAFTLDIFSFAAATFYRCSPATKTIQPSSEIGKIS